MVYDCGIESKVRAVMDEMRCGDEVGIEFWAANWRGASRDCVSVGLIDKIVAPGHWGDLEACEKDVHGQVRKLLERLEGLLDYYDTHSRYWRNIMNGYYKSITVCEHWSGIYETKRYTAEEKERRKRRRG